MGDRSQLFRRAVNPLLPRPDLRPLLRPRRGGTFRGLALERTAAGRARVRPLPGHAHPSARALRDSEGDADRRLCRPRRAQPRAQRSPEQRPGDPVDRDRPRCAERLCNPGPNLDDGHRGDGARLTLARASGSRPCATSREAPAHPCCASPWVGMSPRCSSGCTTSMRAVRRP